MVIKLKPVCALSEIMQKVNIQIQASSPKNCGFHIASAGDLPISIKALFKPKPFFCSLPQASNDKSYLI